ncbi:MAG: DUF5684 domain-containing protein [Gemmataceae bacterium]
MMATLLNLAIWAQFQNPGGPQFGPGGPRFGPGAGGPPPGAAGALVGIMICYFLFLAVLVTFSIIVSWKLFTKAGEPGWASLIPIYNMLVMARICGRPEVFGLVYLIPCVGAILLCFDLARRSARTPASRSACSFWESSSSRSWPSATPSTSSPPHPPPPPAAPRR